MGGFLYFVPARSGIAKEDLAGIGLGYLEPCQVVFRTASGGPGGKAGVVFTAPAVGVEAETGLVGYHPTQQDWEPMDGRDVWLGRRRGQTFGPADFLRATGHDGHWVKLGDGHEWLVPVLRMLDGVTPLPRRLKLTGAGWVPSDVLPDYQDVFSEACRLWDLMAGITEDGTVTYNDECGLAVAALGLNYRVGPGEISALGLLDTRTSGQVLKAVVDWPALEAIKKKLDSGEPSLPDGAPASCPDTDPP